ncbi:hypothetical protein L218DRAFT_986026 [Marasmius fiardii PR-910]|nr:hypothetical protein L218DRAFT_986026 [Marasmius fiardii PR-910]
MNWPQTFIGHRGHQTGMTEPVKLLILDFIEKKTSSIVYSGQLEVGEKSEQRSVVAKFAKMEVLLEETRNYAKLAKLQGTCIPIFYGMFVGSDDKKRDVTCIVIEHCGIHMPCLIERLHSNDRALILNNVLQIHNQKMLHLDLHEGNILQQGDKYRIIDLERMQDHICGFNNDCDFTKEAPTWERLFQLGLCPEMMAVVIDANFCDSGRVPVSCFI